MVYCWLIPSDDDQMKGMDIIFQMIPHKSVWVKWFGHHSPAKLSIFPEKSKALENAAFPQALHTV